MQINLGLDTDNVSARDAEILMFIAGATVPTTLTATEEKKAPAKSSGKGKTKDTPTQELADAAEPMEEKEVVAEPTVSLDDIREIATDIVEDETEGGGQEQFAAALKKVGAASMSKVPKEKFDEFYAMLKVIKKKMALG